MGHSGSHLKVDLSLEYHHFLDMLKEVADRPYLYHDTEGLKSAIARYSLMMDLQIDEAASPDVLWVWYLVCLCIDFVAYLGLICCFFSMFCIPKATIMIAQSLLVSLSHSERYLRKRVTNLMREKRSTWSNSKPGPTLVITPKSKASFHQ